jgi:hypothetical protein
MDSLSTPPIAPYFYLGLTRIVRKMSEIKVASKTIFDILMVWRRVFNEKQD